jgi:hypothetical protein
MNLIDALCVIASSYNARSPEEERVYHQARDLIEAHADTVTLRYREEQSKADTILFGPPGTLIASGSEYSPGALQ